MDKSDTKGLFICPHCQYHHRVFRVTCPNCGRVLVRDLSAKTASLQDFHKTDVISGRGLITAIAILTVIWIAVLLFFYYY